MLNHPLTDFKSPWLIVCWRTYRRQARIMDLTKEEDDGKESVEPSGEAVAFEDSDAVSTPREQWSGRADFVLSVVGFCVGLGNIWRFPYLCYKNGGGAFLIPYLFFLVIAAAPTFLLELTLGQLTSQGGLGCWAICPVFYGIGIAATIVCFLINVYYIVILAWALYYLVRSFDDELPWSHCQNVWNSNSCRTSFDNNVSEDVGLTTPATSAGKRPVDVDPAVEFWERKVLQISDGIEESGPVVWQLAVSLLLIWMIVYFCVWKGVKLTGKVVYVTAIFPYFVLTALFIRGVTLEGASEGILVFLEPDFNRLLDPQVWIDGGTQVCYSFALGMNAMVALGSYNHFRNNVYRQWLFITVVNCLTSLFAGFVIFSVLGFMAKEQGVDVQDVANSGPGLAFIVYPKAVTRMPLPQLWSVIFFLMIVSVGLDSQFGGVEAFLTVVKDLFPSLQKGYRRETVIAVVVTISYAIGLSMVTQGGMYVFQLFDYYSASGMLLVALSEVVAIAWVYGVDRFYDNLEMMIGYRISPYMKISWLFLSPILVTGIFLFTWSNFEGVTYNRKYVYPVWAQALGLCMAVGPILFIPGYALLRLALTPGTLKQRWKKVTLPVLPPERIPATWPDAHKLKVASRTTNRRNLLFSCVGPGVDIIE